MKHWSKMQLFWVLISECYNDVPCGGQCVVVTWPGPDTTLSLAGTACATSHQSPINTLLLYIPVTRHQPILIVFCTTWDTLHYWRHQVSHHLIDIRSNRKLVHKNILSNLSIVNVIDSIMYQAEQGWVITNKNSFCYKDGFKTS